MTGPSATVKFDDQYLTDAIWFENVRTIGSTDISIDGSTISIELDDDLLDSLVEQLRALQLENRLSSVRREVEKLRKKVELAQQNVAGLQSSWAIASEAWHEAKSEYAQAELELRVLQGKVDA